MPKELKFTKPTQGGKVEITLRILDKLLFFKWNDTTHAKQAIEYFRNKGVSIEEGKGWIKVDLFGNNENVILGDKEIDLMKTSQQELEQILCEFYKQQYKKSGFFVVEKKQ